MLFHIDDCPKRFDLDTISEIIRFGAKELGLDNDVFVYFDFSDDVEKGFAGFCHALDCDEGEYVVEINRRLGLKNVTRTIFHELTHVKQQYDGRLEQEGPQSKWYGREFEVAYIERPWEIEAYESERMIFEKWTKQKSKS